MTLAKKIEQLLKGELRSENIKIVIELTEFLKYKESQKIWNEVNEDEPEYLTQEERERFEEVKAKGEFLDQDEILKELGINEDEIQNKV
jgi:hypothetical protein